MDNSRITKSASAERSGIWAQAAAIMILAYQMIARSLFPPACRFLPSCSDYTMAVIRQEGLRRGSIKGFKRLLTCHPFSRSPNFSSVCKSPPPA